jgi:hypothetical protein
MAGRCSTSMVGATAREARACEAAGRIATLKPEQTAMTAARTA